MKIVKVNIICVPREIDIISQAARECREEYVISQWNDEPIEYSVEITGTLLQYLLNSRLRVFLNM